jgi:hypothetical protein
MKQTVEVAIEYAGSVISSFGTNGVPNGISAIKEMIASGFKSGAEWRSKQSPWIKVSDGLPDVDDYYLVTDGESISMAYFFKGWGKFAKYHKYPHPFYDGEWGKIGLDGSCQNKRKSSIFKEPDGSIHDVDAFSKVPVKKFLFATRTWTENIHKIGWIGGLFETDENGILTGRYFGRCNVKDYQNGYMPKGKKEIPCREIEISPDNWIMTVESNNEALIELSKIYDIVWRQCPCLKGIMNTNVTPELERLACEQMKG